MIQIKSISAGHQSEEEASRLSELGAAEPAVLAAQDERRSVVVAGGQEEAPPRTAGLAGKEVSFVGSRNGKMLDVPF